MAYPYQKHIWVTREIIRREYLQNIEDGIYDEQQERLQADAELAQDLADEVSRATNAEDALTTALQAESTRAQTAESAEATRAQSAESNLSNRISAEVTRATGVEESLSNDIDSLDERISNEYTRATNAESALGTRVSTLETSGFVKNTDYATLSKPGIVKPDGVTTSIDANGVISATGGGSAVEKAYKTNDPASTTINDTDYIPMSETDGTKKKTLWSTIIAKVKDALPAIKLPLQYKTIDANYKTSFRTETKGDANSGAYISTVRATAASVEDAPQYSAGLAWGGAGSTNSYLNISHTDSKVYVGAGSNDNLTWAARVYTTGDKPTWDDVESKPSFATVATSGSYTDLTDKPTSFTPSSHASTGTGYGAGNASNYGHVKLSDTYTSSVGGASSSIGASQSALYNVYSLLPRSYVYSESLQTISTQELTYYNLMMTIPRKGYYLFVINLRCYGGGTYPATVNVYTGSSVSGDADGGLVALSEYSWYSMCVLAQKDAGTYAVLSLRNHTDSSHFNVRAKAILIYPT